LTFRAGVNDGVVHACDRGGYRASGSEGRAKIGTSEVSENLLKGAEEEHLVLNDGTAKRSSELVATEIVQRLAIRGSRRESLCAEIFEGAAVNVIGARFRNDIDDAACGSANSALAPEATTWNSLTASKVMSIARAARRVARRKSHCLSRAIEADVVEGAALTIEMISSPSGPW